MAGTAVKWKLKPLLLLSVLSLGLFFLTIKLFQHTAILKSHLHANNDAISLELTNEQNNQQQQQHLKSAGDVYVRWYEPSGEFNVNDPGEGGLPITLNGKDEKVKAEQSYSQYGFNQYVSDKISLHRSLEDVRPKE